MKDARIAGYAKALFEIASTENQIDRVADELFRIARTLEAENELRQTLTDIAVPVEAKDKLLSDILGAKVSTHTLGILRFVIGQGLARDLVGIADELAALAEKESRREIAEVRSAVAMSDDQIARLGAALGRSTGKDVTVKVIIDPSVIGGVLARVGDVVIDGTVRKKLQSLKEHLGVR